jgi:hypothetical protein
MKFYEVLPFAIEQGKKIRHSHWNERRFIIWDKDLARFLDEDHIYFRVGEFSLALEGWEVLDDED